MEHIFWMGGGSRGGGCPLKRRTEGANPHPGTPPPIQKICSKIKSRVSGYSIYTLSNSQSSHTFLVYCNTK